MKDAITYANEAGFFEFNVIGWKAEFERLIEAVRADALAELATVNDSLTVQDHIRDVTKMVKRPQNCGTGFCSCIECVVKPDHIADAGKMVITTEQARQIEVALLNWKAYVPLGKVALWDESDEQALSAIRAARAQEPMKRDDKQLADWLMRSPQTGEKLRFAGAPEQFGHMSRVRLRDSDGNDWTLTAGLQEGWLTEEQRSANLAVAIAEETEAAIAQADHIADADKMVQEPVAWEYCPECGSLDVKHEEGNYKQCARCFQEWFSDVDYSDVVQQNLNRLYAAPVRTKDLTDEEIEDAVGWTMTEQSILDCRAVIAADREKNND